MEREKEIAKVTFREFLNVHNATDDDIDVVISYSKTKDKRE